MSLPHLHIDFETRSLIDLREVGAYRYAQDPSTDVWCMAWRLGKGKIHLWEREDGRLPLPVQQHLEKDGRVYCWNAGFERSIWREIMVRRYGWPAVPLVQWGDTMARAASLGLPLKLGQCAPIFGLEKDGDGNRLALRMAKPRRIEEDGTVVWWDVPEKRERLGEYCIQDVEVESTIGHALGPLPPDERQVWEVDQRINDRGVKIDVDLARKAKRIVVLEERRVNRRIRELTDEEVRRVSDHNGIRQWINTQGVKTKTVKRAWLEEVLGNGASLPGDVREVLQLRLDAGRSSTAKLDRFMSVPLLDTLRAHGLLTYHGAATGRWAGRLIQPQNLPRGDWDADDEVLLELIAGGHRELIRLIYGPPLQAVASILRGLIIAGDGRLLYSVDYKSIEAVVVAWLAGEERLLEVFRTHGLAYEDMATGLYGVDLHDVTKSQRALGKVGVLGCGYQMGAETLQRQAKEQHGLELSLAVCQQIVDTYRQRYYRIPQLWYEFQDRCMEAVRNPGTRIPVAAGKLAFQVRGAFLWMQLPSGRELAYARPHIAMKPMPWDPEDIRPAVRVWHLSSYTYQWTTRDLYGGLLAENATQAVARDVMSEAMVELELENPRYDPILTVHDEILSEGPPDGSVEEIVDTMTRRPAWAQDCPIRAEGWSGRRYKKD